MRQMSRKLCACAKKLRILPSQATSNFVVHYKALSALLGCGEIRIRWYELQDTGHPIATYTVNTVAIQPLAGAPEPILLWPPRRATARRYPPRPSAVGAAGDSPHDDPQQEGDADIDHGISEDGTRPEDQEEVDIFGDLEELSEPLLDHRGPVVQEDAQARSAAGESDDMVAPNAPANASSGSGDPPPPPAPCAGGARSRTGAAVTLQVPGGSISFYPSKNAFEAVCEHRGHGRCVLTRTRNPKRNTGALGAAGGRPVGLMAAWLGCGEGLPTKDAHWKQEALERPLAERASVRAQIEACGDSGRHLLSFERPLESGEPVEPVTLEGYFGAQRR